MFFFTFRLHSGMPDAETSYPAVSFVMRLLPPSFGAPSYHSAPVTVWLPVITPSVSAAENHGISTQGRMERSGSYSSVSLL